MSIRVKDIVLLLEEEEPALPRRAAEILEISPGQIQKLKIVKKSLDARRKNRIHFVYTVELTLSPAEEKRILDQTPAGVQIQEIPETPAPGPVRILKRPAKPPIVVGTGPAGLFAALKLAENGLPPLVLERGKEVPRRVKDVERFWHEGTLESESNVQFGEGGAGTFSDGKLYTRLNDPRVAAILEILHRFGAPSEILFLQRPHIGTDHLRRVILALRRHLQEQGVEFRFQSRVTGMKIFHDEFQGVVVNEKDELDSSVLFLAPGNGARDTFRMLQNSGVALEPKAFAMGLRVEHTQRLIDRIQYGRSAGHPRLPPADYQLTHRDSKGRAVYSFCMCPGGSVIAASSESQGLVTNGMSLFHRHSPWANSALVVSVGMEDFGGRGPLAGMEFQRRWEEMAYGLGGGKFKAPAQGVQDFLQNRVPGPVRETSYRPGITPARLDDCLPGFVGQSLREALPYFNRKMSRFISSEAVLIGVETRTSCPLRILRNADYQSQNVRGLYPIGEGSGYAGGIISSALDGIKAVEAVLKKL